MTRPCDPAARHRRAPARGIWLLAVAAALAVGGCGASPKLSVEPGSPPAPAPAAEPPSRFAEPAIETVDEASLQLEHAERRVGELLREREQPRPAEPPPPVAEGPPEPGRPGPMSSKEDRDYGLSATDRCQLACNALASMQRSAGRLCELTGQDDPRCENVLQRVEVARQLVHAACPACATAAP
jgi:hypothetical protein